VIATVIAQSLNVIVGVSDAKCSSDPGETLVTHALGSCVAVMLYDPIAQVAGMLHYQLPSSSENPERAVQNPCMFADSGMKHLLAELTELGALQARLRVRIAGAAEMLDESKVFNIGRRNHTAIRKVLWQLGMMIEAEDIGGSAPRTAYLAVGDGAVSLKIRGEWSSL
jgi:chemotaxis protein CheD